MSTCRPRPRPRRQARDRRYFELIPRSAEDAPGGEGRPIRTNAGRGDPSWDANRPADEGAVAGSFARAPIALQGWHAQGAGQATGDRRIFMRYRHLGGGRRPRATAEISSPRPSAFATPFTTEWPTIQVAPGPAGRGARRARPFGGDRGRAVLTRVRGLAMGRASARQ